MIMVVFWFYELVISVLLLKCVMLSHFAQNSCVFLGLYPSRSVTFSCFEVAISCCASTEEGTPYQLQMLGNKRRNIQKQIWAKKRKDSFLAGVSGFSQSYQLGLMNVGEVKQVGPSLWVDVDLDTQVCWRTS